MFRFRVAFLLGFALATLPLTASTQGRRGGGRPPGAGAAEQGGGGGTFGGLRFRSIGPAMTSGRVIAFAVDPTDRSKYYVAAASGGVWKTVNAGTTWTPVFDNEGSYSIGAIALDPGNPSVVWVGTGECNAQRSVGYGDGVYKSEDAGKSWKNVGLKTSEHIGRIAIDPVDSNVVYVASQGPLWGPDGDRGLYKTIDGGKSWKQVLKISGDTGATDIVIDPKNPKVLYGAAWQRRRHVFTYIGGGPESAIYKSTDAGATWNKLRSGLPGEEMGRIGLAISPADNRVIYATVEAANGAGGIFRSSDFGATWEKRSSTLAQGMYYGQIICDPKNVDRVYVCDVVNQVTDDGGRTFRVLGETRKHVDNHAIWIDPNNTDYILSGCDGGVYESFDRGANWQFKANLPIAQFYDVDVSNEGPFYHVYGGTQDNNSLGGPARTRSAAGITNADWFITHGGDGFHTRVDPMDSNTIYATMQYGGVVRYDRRSGERTGIQPQSDRGEPPLRWNWDSPLLISPHSHTRVYFAGNRLFRSDDRGDTWKAISPDLTRQLDRNALPIMGKIMRLDAVAKHQSTSLYGNVTALAESFKKENLLYAGTDDGLIQVTEDCGKTWRKVETFPDVPSTTYVSRLLTSRHEAETVYAAFDNHKRADFKPYLLKSLDAGKTWSSIVGDLPANGPVLAIAEDHLNPDLLFVGTEFGVFFTQDGGKKWIRLRGGLPTIAVRDIAIQRQVDDLVIATFGRGFYVLDGYAPLRTATPDALKKDAIAFPIKDALTYLPDNSRNSGFQGANMYTAENPPFGAVITYFLKESLKTRKQIRQDAEREAERKKEVSPYPTNEQLKAEADEEPPSVILTISDSARQVVRRLSGPTSAGIHRVSWDLRYPSVAPPQPESVETPVNGRSRGGGSGVPVLPGKYRIAIAKRVLGLTAELAAPVEFSVRPLDETKTLPADRTRIAAFHQKLAKLQRAVSGTLETANSLSGRLPLMKRAIQDTPAAPPKLLDQSREIQEKLDLILIALRGDPGLRAREENQPPSIQDRLGYILSSQFASTGPVTSTSQRSYEFASSDLALQVGELRRLVKEDLARLEKAMDAAGCPWTPGRLPEWKEEK